MHFGAYLLILMESSQNWPDAAWLPRTVSGELSDCSTGQLGACQPVLAGAGGCGNLCRQTLGCVAWTYVRPHPTPKRLLDPKQWCNAERYPSKLRANLSTGGRCCLQQHWPAADALPTPAACCTAGRLQVPPCRQRCRMPWGSVALMDDLTPSELDKQRRDMIGGPASVHLFPWVRVQQQYERPSPQQQQQQQQQKGRRGAQHCGGTPGSGSGGGSGQPPRIAVCMAGAARALIHPLVWRSAAEHVLGRNADGADGSVHGGGDGNGSGVAGHDLFAVLGTGSEDQRSRTNELPLDEQPQLRSEAGAWLLGHALSALKPVAVRMVAGSANASCGVPATGQFDKLAECVEMAKRHERKLGVRYDLLLKTRPDVRWATPLLQGAKGLGWLARTLCAAPRAVITTDDLNVVAPRATWRALGGMRGGALACDRLCESRYWQWMRGIKTNCLMKAHLARHEIHHVDLLGGAAPPYDVLHATRLATPHGGTVDDLEMGRFQIARNFGAAAKDHQAAATPDLRHEGLAVTCEVVPPPQPPQSSPPPSSAPLSSSSSSSSPPSPLDSSAATCAAVVAPRPVRCSLCRSAASVGVARVVEQHLGFCEVTEGEGDCARGDKGTWETHAAGQADGLRDLAGCMRRCGACARCNWVSFSHMHEDCSWFHACDPRAVARQSHFLAKHFVTVRVPKPGVGADGIGTGGNAGTGAGEAEPLLPAPALPMCPETAELIGLNEAAHATTASTFVASAAGAAGARAAAVAQRPRGGMRLRGAHAAADPAACVREACPGCERALAAFEQTGGRAGDQLGARVDRAAKRAHLQRVAAQLEAAVGATLRRRGPRQQQHAAANNSRTRLVAHPTAMRAARAELERYATGAHAALLLLPELVVARARAAGLRAFCSTYRLKAICV